MFPLSTDAEEGWWKGFTLQQKEAANLLFLQVGVRYRWLWQGTPVLDLEGGLIGMDNLGNLYSLEGLTMPHGGYANWSREGLFSSELQIVLLNIPKEAEWILLDYQWYGAAFQLRVPLKWR